MAHQQQQKDQAPKPLDVLARELGMYPVEAFQFVREGLQFTVERLQACPDGDQRHITGQDLCWGLRDYALKRWGMMAPTVLRSWNIRDTADFGKLVFAMVDTGWMAKNETDRIEDFHKVYDFRSAFETTIEIS